MNLLLRLYDYLHTHRAVLWCTFAVVTALLIAGASTLRYREDISDFLPSDSRQQVEAYASDEAQRIVIIFEGASPDSLCAAVDRFEEQCLAYGLSEDALTTSADPQDLIRRLQAIHANAPYYLTEDDYRRMDTLFTPEGFRTALARDKQLLSMPGSGLLAPLLSSDPLGLFPLPLRQGEYPAGGREWITSAGEAFISYNGYMMTSDSTKAFAFYRSPYGATESRHNAHLIDSLQHVIDHLSSPPKQGEPEGGFSPFPSGEGRGEAPRLHGAPVVAVGNARRIKADSFLAIGLSSVLIVLLLLYSFPRKRDILLIAVSVAFGWLCGMAMLRVFAGEVSVIILGIGSVIIGLAVNYPLHLLVHQRYTTSVRQTLEEVLSPLLIGNITTVGAFLALLPIDAMALRDLGIFAASMLLGTIMFCVVVLPHLMSAEPTPLRVREAIVPLVGKELPTFSFRHVPFAVVVAITLFFGAVLFIHRGNSRFDSDLSHINYMTPQQRADFALFTENATLNTSERLSTPLNPSERVFDLWSTWWSTRDREQLHADFRQAAAEQGFSPTAFAPFEEVFFSDHLPPFPLGEGRGEAFQGRAGERLLSTFNYLGLVCSCIVFVFLVFSFRSLRLAIIAFLPMAVAWVWILGIMQLTGIQFNIVNIILATFIFGQGDDYTIFVLEGALYEKKTGQPMLPQYRQSILLSALIMLISLGVLLVARHPAMHSLGTVTLIGMTCVVLMAWVIPPVLVKHFTPYKSTTYDT
ncbi:MAG: MMPL family transporter [Paludibacteraceae bacterium]|nr:MMPL family transporter [Paludibacteraceae bacterium]